MKIATPDWLKIKKCRVIKTKDLKGNHNGDLIDILNRNDIIFDERKHELFQQYYMCTVFKYHFKGLHIHPTKLDTLHCVFGKICLVIYPEIINEEDIYTTNIDINKFIILELGGNNPITVTFPSIYPHGYFGVDEISVIINYRNPAWTPEDVYQYDISCDQIIKHLNEIY